MPRYQNTLTAAEDEVLLNLADGEAENLLIQVRGGTTPNIVLEVSLDEGTTWDGVEVADVDTPGTGLAAIVADGLYKPTSNIGAAGLARIRRTDGNGGNAIVVANTALS